jgi:hypothetical protein
VQQAAASAAVMSQRLAASTTALVNAARAILFAPRSPAGTLRGYHNPYDGVRLEAAGRRARAVRRR